jgi:hypothetical protein
MVRPLQDVESSSSQINALPPQYLLPGLNLSGHQEPLEGVQLGSGQTPLAVGRTGGDLAHCGSICPSGTQPEGYLPPQHLMEYHHSSFDFTDLEVGTLFQKKKICI